MGLNQPILAELEQEAKTTRRMLERVPEAVLSWRPHEKSMPLGRLTGHVAELPGWLSEILKQDELDFSTGNYQPAIVSNTAELLKMFDESVSKGCDALKTCTDEQLLKTWRLRNGDQIFFELPRLVVVRTMVLNHLVHHRGQLSVYLRLQNVPLPSVYGPTADEQM